MIEAALRGVDAAPTDQAAKYHLATVLQSYPRALPGREALLHQLVRDPLVSPDAIAPSAWLTLGAAEKVLIDHDGAALAAWIERDDFARDLLEQAPVSILAAELALTAMRRWLLFSGSWEQFPLTVAALKRQQELNGGAWLVATDEAAQLANGVPEAIGSTFPVSVNEAVSGGAAAVAAQYRQWPYPVWSRISAQPSSTLGLLAKSVDPHGALWEREPRRLLIAGCGTGHEAAIWANRFPDAEITAIDISSVSLDFARTRCARLGYDNIRFELLDLHQVSKLGIRFDVIVCSGVLHHLARPEEGWAALVSALADDGILRIMVYSRIARLGLQGLRKKLADLVEQPVDDDVLRAARARLIAQAPQRMTNGDYFTLGGIKDLLFNAHEDLFDIPRIERGIAALGLQLLSFSLPLANPPPDHRKRFPHDPLRRDFSVWRTLERENPLLFQHMYGFWCGRGRS